MDARLRLTFFCGTCLGLAVGFAAGHLSIWQRIDSPRVSFNEPIDLHHSASMGTGGYRLPEVLSAPELNTPGHVLTPGGAVVLNDPDFGDEPVHADALVEVLAPHTPREVSSSASKVTPPNTLVVSQSRPLARQAVSTPTGPQPATSRTQQAQAVSSDAPSAAPLSQLDPEVVKMLKDELEGVSEQQREVWADALQGMNPADAAGIILMWKKFGQNTSGLHHLSSPPPLFRSSHPDAAPTPLQESHSTHSLQPAPLSNDLSSSENLGARIAQHNQANRETCGYLEMIPILMEVAFDAEQVSEHAEVVGYRLHTESGRHLETGNPSHVSVQRGCFFAVTLPSGEEQYTRVGRLVLDADRRLCVDLGDRDLPVTPEVKLPEGTTRFMVRSGQLLVEIAGQPEPVTVGPLQVAEFFDASRLLPMGGCLYGATTASGKPNLVAAELIHETLEYPSIENRSTTSER